MRAEDLSPDERQLVHDVRMSVEIPPGTVVQRVIPLSDAVRYLADETTDGADGRGRFAHTTAFGFTARMQDLAGVRTVADLVEALRLDYAGSPFTDGVPAVATLRFVSGADLAVPFGSAMADTEPGGLPYTRSDDPPFTGTGFTASADHRVPEAHTGGPVELTDGAELWAVADGREVHLGTYDLDTRSWLSTEAGAQLVGTETTDGRTDADLAGRLLRGVAGTDLPGIGERSGPPRGVRGQPGGPGVHPGQGARVAPDGARDGGHRVPADVAVPVARGDVLGAVAERAAGSPPAGLGRGPVDGGPVGPDADGQDGLGGRGPGVGGDRPGAGAPDGLTAGDDVVRSALGAGHGTAVEPLGRFAGHDVVRVAGSLAVVGPAGAVDPDAALGEVAAELAADPDRQSTHAEFADALRRGSVRYLQATGAVDGTVDLVERPTSPTWQPGQDETGVPRDVVDRGRYTAPGADVEAALRAAHRAAQGELAGWVGAVNPHLGEHPVGSTGSEQWTNNCGDCARRVADAVQGLAVRAAWGDPRLGEYAEMWGWTGDRPSAQAVAPEPSVDPDGRPVVDDTSAFTTSVWADLGRALRGAPVGTVAIVGVDWHVPGLARGRAGGHWFNAVVTDRGLLWVDGQDGTAAGWPPSYPNTIWRGEAVVRRPGAAWEGVDLGAGRDGGDAGGGGRSGAPLDGDRRPGDGGPLGGEPVPGRLAGDAADDPARGSAAAGAGRPGAAGAPRPGDPGPGPRTHAGGPPGLTDGVTADQLVRLAEQVTSPDGRVRRRAAAAAAELLPLLGLDEGRYAADGTRTGGSPDFEATVAALPADARTAVAVLGLAADPDLLPSGLPGLGAAVAKV
ncbi:toxin glutamine deamidase domain-containing protein, partial [Klenkia sp. PcliD-1-E]|uniref:toxin glutamine deamidase domain-containing protein n=1 Tax=Klenkia sp. PcliD-1-E TaxID=2954492 RepID=UPI002096C7C6